MENFLSSMWLEGNPNPNRKPNPKVRVKVNSREINERLKSCNQMHNKNIVVDVKGKLLKSCVDKKFFILDVT